MPVTKPELVKGLKVLIVEDTPANQQVALFMLNRLGCDVDISDNGLLALQAVEKCSYDFIFMDCQMPVMDGYEATMELRKREGSKKHTTVIALTAHALSGDKEKCLAAGMDDYLSKPIMQKDLIDIMEKWDKKNHENEADYVSAILKQTSSLITPHGLEIFERLDDLSQVLEAEDLIDIINQFIMDAPVLLEELKNGITAKDAQQVKKTAHTLKGSVANIGAARLAQLCGEIEEQAKNNFPDNIEDIFSQIRAMWHEIIEILLTYKNKLSEPALL